MTADGLERAHRRFNYLLTLAEERLAIDDVSAATAVAQLAALSAFPQHIGLFASPRLERLLLQLGHRIPAPAAARIPRVAGEKERVVHVLTYARPVGGDTRFVWRWIQEDPSRCHSVVLTSQEDANHEIPAALRSAVEASGGEIHILPGPASRLIDKAAALRSVLYRTDAAFLHLFPYDIVPVLALAGTHGAAAVGFVHHSDHTFWVGSSIVNLMVHARAQPSDFLRRRRGLIPERCAILPIPLVPAPRQLPQFEAKRALGFAPETVLVVTIATAFKYEPLQGKGFLDLVAPVIRDNPQARLVAIGPRPQGRWLSAAAATAATAGRIEARGPQFENSLLLDAADIYLDSYPFSSITSLLEAGCHGIPVLACQPSSPELWPLGPGAPGLDVGLERAPTPEAYRTRLGQMIADPALRQQLGERARSEILAQHTRAGWRAAVEQVYIQLHAAPEQGCLAGTQDDFERTALDVALDSLYGTNKPDLANAIDTLVSELPYSSRRAVLWRLMRGQFQFSRSKLLPPSLAQAVDGRLHKLRQLAQRVRSGS